VEDILGRHKQNLLLVFIISSGSDNPTSPALLSEINSNLSDGALPAYIIVRENAIALFSTADKIRRSPLLVAIGKEKD
jgi:hypothetical protein